MTCANCKGGIGPGTVGILFAKCQDCKKPVCFACALKDHADVDSRYIVCRLCLAEKALTGETPYLYAKGIRG